MTFNKLYGIDKNGGVKVWEVTTKDNIITVTHGKLDGKLQSKNTTCEGKNIGRSNETTPSEQARLEAQSKWCKQYDKYYRESVEEATQIQTEGVMLAQDYTKTPHYLDDEFYISPKLDGLRVKTTFVDGEPKWESRGGKEYPVPEHLIEGLKHINKHGYEVLDGEAYIHGVKLQKIQSCVKKSNDITPQVSYQIFDLPMLDMNWTTRNSRLSSIGRLTRLNSIKMIQVIPQEYCTKDKLDRKLQQYIEDGFEGAMMRNLRGEYLFQNKRSNDLLKYKLMKDSECKVLSVSCDKNMEGVLLCEWNDVQFELKMKGTHEYRIYENQLNLVGEWINFTYQDLTEDGVPTFAVGQYIRECNSTGTPVE